MVNEENLLGNVEACVFSSGLGYVGIPRMCGRDYRGYYEQVVIINLPAIRGGAINPSKIRELYLEAIQRKNFFKKVYVEPNNSGLQAIITNIFSERLEDLAKQE
jgi:hypothetical protein